jgi:hypothetical protein
MVVHRRSSHLGQQHNVSFHISSHTGGLLHQFPKANISDKLIPLLTLIAFRYRVQ